MTAALEGGEWSAVRPGRTLPPRKTRYVLYRRLGGPQGRFGRAENLVPTGIRSPDRPARSQSLYRLSYPAHNVEVKTYEFHDLILERFLLTGTKHGALWWERPRLECWPSQPCRPSATASDKNSISPFLCCGEKPTSQKCVRLSSVLWFSGLGAIESCSDGESRGNSLGRGGGGVDFTDGSGRTRRRGLRGRKFQIITMQDTEKMKILTDHWDRWIRSDAQGGAKVTWYSVFSDI